MFILLEAKTEKILNILNSLNNNKLIIYERNIT